MQFAWMKKAFRSAYFLYKRYLEDPFWMLTQTRPDLFKAGHVLDVGANIGYTALVFAQSIDSAFRVFAFEPESANFSLLKETVESRRATDTVVPVHAAIGAKDATVELWVNKNHHGDHRIVTPHYRNAEMRLDRVSVVPMTSIDIFTASERIRSEIAFIKVDVQGYELPVCEGMEQTIAENPDISVAIEYSPDELVELGFEPPSLLGYWADRGFLCCVINRDGSLTPVPLVRWDNQVCQKRGYVNLLFSRNRRRSAKA